MSNPIGVGFIPEDLEHKIAACRTSGGIITSPQHNPYTLTCVQTTITKLGDGLASLQLENSMNTCNSTGGRVIHNNSDTHCMETDGNSEYKLVNLNLNNGGGNIY